MILTPGLTSHAPRFADLVAMLRERANTPQAPAIHFHACSDAAEGEALSYGELWHSAVATSHYLHAAGVRAGDPVVLLLPTGLHFTIYFFGILLCGGVAVPLASDTLQKGSTLDFAQLRPTIDDCGARHVIAAPELAAALQAEMPTLHTLCEAPPRTLDALPEVPLNRDPARLALMQYTSGSTSHPKAVMLSHHNLASNLHAITAALRVTPGIDVAVSWLPLYHDMGLIGMFLSALHAGVPLHLMPPKAFVRAPRRWLKLLSEHRATITTVPNFAFRLCTTRVDLDGLDLSSVRVIMNGSEPITMADLERFADAYAPAGLRRECITPVYGLAESALAVTFCGEGPPKADLVSQDDFAAQRIVPPRDGQAAKAIVCVGRAIPTQRVRIADEAGRSLPDCHIGRILVSGPSVMQGYHRRPEANAQALQGGWLVTGDLGYLRDGELYITGREKDVIIHNGRNHYPQDIEDRVGAHPLVRAGRVIAFWMGHDAGGREGVVVMLESKAREETEKIQVMRDVAEVVSTGSGLPVRDVRVVERGHIPLTTSGKVRRQPAKQIYQSLV